METTDFSYLNDLLKEAKDCNQRLDLLVGELEDKKKTNEEEMTNREQKQKIIKKIASVAKIFDEHYNKHGFVPNHDCKKRKKDESGVSKA